MPVEEVLDNRKMLLAWHHRQESDFPNDNGPVYDKNMCAGGMFLT
jgi:hypothetical protein